MPRQVRKSIPFDIDDGKVRALWHAKHLRVSRLIHPFDIDLKANSPGNHMVVGDRDPVGVDDESRTRTRRIRHRPLVSVYKHPRRNNPSHGIPDAAQPTEIAAPTT